MVSLGHPIVGKWLLRSILIFPVMGGVFLKPSPLLCCDDRAFMALEDMIVGFICYSASWTLTACAMILLDKYGIGWEPSMHYFHPCCPLPSSFFLESFFHCVSVYLLESLCRQRVSFDHIVSKWFLII